MLYSLQLKVTYPCGWKQIKDVHKFIKYYYIYNHSYYKRIVHNENIWMFATMYVFLRVQNEQFLEEKGFILRYTEKEV